VRPWIEKNQVAIFGDLILTVVAVVMIGVGLSLWHGQQPIKGGVLTTGHIVDLQVEQDTDSNDTYKYPVIEFAEHENVHRFTFRQSGFGGDVGDAVEVRYDPSDPSRAQWADAPGRWFWSIFFLAGVAAVAVEGAILLRRRAGAMGSRKPSLMARVLGPLGASQQLEPGLGPDDQGVRYGYVPTDQPRARRVFWWCFGAIVALNAVIWITVLVFRIT
jgi:hypothetical protein